MVQKKCCFDNDNNAKYLLISWLLFFFCFIIIKKNHTICFWILLLASVFFEKHFFLMWCFFSFWDLCLVTQKKRCQACWSIQVWLLCKNFCDPIRIFFPHLVFFFPRYAVLNAIYVFFSPWAVFFLKPGDFQKKKWCWIFFDVADSYSLSILFLKWRGRSGCDVFVLKNCRWCRIFWGGVKFFRYYTKSLSTKQKFSSLKQNFYFQF